MKILILSQYWYPENGVPQRRWSWLAQTLADAGHDVTVIAPPPHYQRRIDGRTWLKERKFFAFAEETTGPSGERIIRSGFIPAGPSLTQRALNQATVALGAIWVVLKRPSILKGYCPDLIIGTVPALPTAVATAVSSIILRCPYIIDLRDAWPDLLQQSSKWNRGTGKRSLRERILTKGPFQVVSAMTRLALHKALKHGAGIAVTSSYLQRDLSKRRMIQRKGRAPEIVTVRNVFPPETLYRASPKTSRPNDELNVLYAGTLGRAQNLANALEAARLAKNDGVNIHLRFVGAGVAREALVEEAKKTGVRVSFEGRQPAGELDEYYAWADTALVHLTDWEPLNRAVPSKTYELMSARMHISGVVSGETAELIREHGAGDVVPPENPLALASLWGELARDRSRLSVTGDGPEWVERERERVAPMRLLELVGKVGKHR